MATVTADTIDSSKVDNATTTISTTPPTTTETTELSTTMRVYPSSPEPNPGTVNQRAVPFVYITFNSSRKCKKQNTYIITYIIKL